MGRGRWVWLKFHIILYHFNKDLKLNDKVGFLYHKVKEGQLSIVKVCAHFIMMLLTTFQHCSAPFISFFILWYVATKFSQKRYQVRQRYKWGPKEWVLLCLTFLLCYNNEQGSKILNFLQKHLIFFHIMTLTMRGNELSGEEILFMSLNLQNILLQHKTGWETSLKIGTIVYHFKSFSKYI